MIKKHKKAFIFLFGLAFVLAVYPLAGRALVARTGNNVLTVEDTKGNFFGAGNLVVINGVVDGDVFVAGNSISIKGTVNGDVFAAGNIVDVFGTIKGNLRTVGSNINIRGRVEKNILSASANFIADEDAFIGGHITHAGAGVILNAPVGGQIDAAVESMTINNSVGGDVNLRMGKNEKSRLYLYDKAVLSGNLKYTAVSEAEIGSGARILGETVFTPIKASKKAIEKFPVSFKKFALALDAIGILSVFVLGLIVLYFVPKILDRIYAAMKEKTWSNIGIGLVALVVVPLLAIMVLFTVVGIPLALMAIAAYAALLYFAKVVVSVALGRLIAERFKWNLHKILSFMLGLAVFSVASFMPFVGWFLVFGAVLWAFGAILRIDSQLLREWR